MHSAKAKEIFSGDEAGLASSSVSDFRPDAQRVPQAPSAEAEKRRPVLSLVIPIFNDGEHAEALCIELAKVLSHYFAAANLDDAVEVIFVDDGSVNDSVAYLKKLALRYRFVKVVELSRNFGHHIA